MGNFAWDLDKYYWPRKAVLRWWEQGWDWDSLKTKQCPHKGYKTYGDCYQPLFEFSLPLDAELPSGRPDVFLIGHDFSFAPKEPELGPAQTVSEDSYWGARWHTEFPEGSGKLWTPYHLPLFDPVTGALSPKHPGYVGAKPWNAKDRLACALGLKSRMRAGRAFVWSRNDEAFSLDHRAPLCGVVLPNGTDLSLFGECVFVNFGGSLFGPRCYFGHWQGNARNKKFMSFGCRSSFAEVQFATSIAFEAAHFGHSADFSKAWFNGAAGFRDSVFWTDASFEKAVFCGYTNFRNAIFLGLVRFFSTKFEGSAEFEEATFCGEVDFEGAQFDRWASFTDSTFLARADFTLGTADTDGKRAGRIERTPRGDDTDGKASADERAVQYQIELDCQHDSAQERAFQSVDFSGSEFWNEVTFENRLFLRRTNFTGTKFGSVATFHGAVLHADTRFVGTQFSGPPACKLLEPNAAKLSREERRLVADAVRTGKALVDAIIIFIDASEEEVSEHRIDFQQVQSYFDEIHRLVEDILDPNFQKYFEKMVRDADESASDAERQRVRRIREAAAAMTKAAEAYRDAETALSVSRGALVHTRKVVAYERREAMLQMWEGRYRPHRAVRKCRVVQWTMSDGQRNEIAAEFEAAFRRLKLLMEAVGARTEEQRFFALEIQSRIERRDNEVKWAERFFGRLYGWVADYGRSVIRPLVNIIVLSAVFTAALAALSIWSGREAPVGYLVNYFFKSLPPSFLVREQSVLGTGASPYQEWLQSVVSVHDAVFSSIVTTHQLVNLVMWLLFALALRRRFQIT